MITTSGGNHEASHSSRPVLFCMKADPDVLANTKRQKTRKMHVICYRNRAPDRRHVWREVPTAKRKTPRDLHDFEV
jgi:hypothetical protein